MGTGVPRERWEDLVIQGLSVLLVSLVDLDLLVHLDHEEVLELLERVGLLALLDQEDHVALQGTKGNKVPLAL